MLPDLTGLPNSGKRARDYNVPNNFEANSEYLKLKDQIEFVHAMAVDYLPELRNQIDAPNGLNEAQIARLNAWYNSMTQLELTSKRMRLITGNIQNPEKKRYNKDLSSTVTSKVQMQLTMYCKPGNLGLVLASSPSSIRCEVDSMLSIFDIFIKDKMSEHTLESEEFHSRSRSWEFNLNPKQSNEWYQSIKESFRQFLKHFSSGEKQWPHEVGKSVFWEFDNGYAYDLWYEMNALTSPM